MIEKALTAAIKAAVPAAHVWPVYVPEGKPLPWVCYREVDVDKTEHHYTSTYEVSFEIDSAAEQGLQPEQYEASKVMASSILEALGAGFDFGDVCVYESEVGKRQDMIDTVSELHWVRSVYKFTFDK